MRIWRRWRVIPLHYDKQFWDGGLYYWTYHFARMKREKLNRLAKKTGRHNRYRVDDRRKCR